MARPARPKATLTKFKQRPDAPGKFIAGPPLPIAETCGACARWDPLIAAAQPAGQPRRGVCCGQPPTVFHTPTAENPAATISTSGITAEGRPACYIFKPRE